MDKIAKKLSDIIDRALENIIRSKGEYQPKDTDALFIPHALIMAKYYELLEKGMPVGSTIKEAYEFYTAEQITRFVMMARNEALDFLVDKLKNLDAKIH